MFNANKEYNITYDANGDIVRDSSAPVDPNFTGQKNNLLGTAAPNSTNDSSDGYSVGSRWVFGAEIYMCVSSVDTAAIWQRCVLIEYEQESIYLTGSVVSSGISPRHVTVSSTNVQSLGSPTAVAMDYKNRVYAFLCKPSSTKRIVI